MNQLFSKNVTLTCEFMSNNDSEIKAASNNGRTTVTTTGKNSNCNNNCNDNNNVIT